MITGASSGDAQPGKSVTGLPAGAKAAFKPTLVTATATASGASSTLTLTAGSSTPAAATR